MEATYTTQRLLVLRKLTRAIGEILGTQLKEHIATLGPLFRPRAVFGEHIQGPTKETVKSSHEAFKELKDLYDTIATKPPFNLPRDLQSPLMQMTSSLELTPWEYVHAAKGDRAAKTVTVTCPFKSVLTYSDYTPQRLKELLANPNRTDSELQQQVLHHLVMRVVISRQPGLTKIFEALHFPLELGRLPGFRELPITFIRSSISTGLPPDELVIESTELAGKDVFEEIINVDDIANIHDPFKERLLELVSQMGVTPTSKHA
jgi:hypothetical protein